MKKELITALVTVLTSTMVTIPARAATPAEGNACGAPSGLPSEITSGCAVGYENEVDPGDITQDTALMNAFGGVDKYYASFERVTPEYFKQKYAEAAEVLKPQIVTTTTESITTSAISAVSKHFTCSWADLGYQNYCAPDQRIFTDYLTTGRMFSGFEPAVLLHTILDSYGIDNDIWDATSDLASCYVSITTGGTTQYVAFGGKEVIVYTTTPVDLSTTRWADEYLGAYKDFID